MKQRGLKFLALAGLLAAFAGSFEVVAETNSLPKFDEVYRLLRTNSHLPEQELNRAAVLGLMNELQSRAILVTNTTPDVRKDLLSRASVFDKNFAYLRLAKIEDGADDALKSSFEKLAATNKVKGVVVDLRFAGGTDYAAAAKIADIFLASKEALLHWDDVSVASTAKSDAISVPVAVLVNHETSGAAEALAGMVRQTQIGLILGTNTAGQASVFKEFPLENGQKLKIASSPVQLGNGKEIPSSGLKPDIEVAVNEETEKSLYENPFRIPEPALADSTNNSAAETVRPRRRINEAELVRLQREGLSPDEFLEAEPKTTEPGKPVLSDPALVRALDLLKGLAVVQQGRK